MNEEIIKKLSERLPIEAVQRTKGSETKKGYDTTGYGYQSAVDRFNEVLGDDWNYEWEILHSEQGKYRDKSDGTPGSSYWEIAVKVSIGIQDKKLRSCVGGHTGKDYADALKGAITNGFKKTAAFWGVGRDAFAGTIDDDNQPFPDDSDNKTVIERVFPGSEEIQQTQFEIGQEVPRLYWSLSVEQKRKYMPKGCKATKIDGKWIILKQSEE